MENGCTFAKFNCKAICEVCDNELTYIDTLTANDAEYSVCRSLACRQVMKQKSAMTPHMFKSHLDFNRKLITQRREKDAARKKHREDVARKESQEHRKIQRMIFDTFLELTEENTSILAIPSGNSKLLAVSSERRNKYIEHLESIVSEACEYANAAELVFDQQHDAYGKRLIVEQRFDDIPALQSISDRLCCMCKGGCCASGKEHAYLSVFTMRRYMDVNPSQSAEQILNDYIANICTHSIENSCINQTQTGCALPRKMRSDVCNGFYCDPLKAYQKKVEAEENLSTVVAIQRSATYWNRFDIGVCNEIVDVAVLDENRVSIIKFWEQHTEID